jgi:hypothetical protein
VNRIFKWLSFFLCLYFLVLSDVLGCINDADCDYGDICIKPSGSVNIEGTCATPTDQFGNPQNVIPTPSAQPHEVSSCQFDMDCDIGFACIKQAGDIDGICMK